MEKIIFFDVDGTLFRRDCGVPESARRAISACLANGHRVMLCTGRNQSILPEEVRRLPLQGMVGGCGTYVALQEDQALLRQIEKGEKTNCFENMQLLTDAALTGEICREILSILYYYHCPFYVENADFVYYDEDYVPPVFQSAVRSMNQYYPSYMKSIREFPNRISKITGYPEERQLLQELKAALSPWLDVIIHEEYVYIEITLKGYSKGTGVLQIMAHLGISKENSYGFGDSGNDLAMLEAVGHGIVMGDAPIFLKQKYQPTDSIYADGIEKGLQRLHLI